MRQTTDLDILGIGSATPRTNEDPPIGNTHFSGHTTYLNFFCQTPLRMPPDAPRVVGHFHKKRQQIHQKYVTNDMFHRKTRF